MKQQSFEEEISSIEQFYEVMEDSNIKKKQFLVLQLSDWINQSIEYDPATNTALNTTLDELFTRLNKYKRPTTQNNIVIRDYLYNLFLFVDDAIQEIILKTRNKILRDHTLLPYYAVKETDSKSLQWLSKKPGRTVREKLANLTHIMAVKRVFSTDTLENRLFKEFIWRLCYLLDLRYNYYLQNGIKLSDKSEDFFSRIQHWKNTEEYEGIKPWRNSSPNNVLLEDKQYRKIWLAWNELTYLDEKIRSDIKNINKNICTYLFWSICSELKGYEEFKFEQSPFVFDQKTNAFPCKNKTFALRRSRNEFEYYEFIQSEEEIEIKKDKKIYAQVSILKNNVIVEKSDTKKLVDVYSESLLELIVSALFEECNKNEKKLISSNFDRQKHIAYDFYDGTIKYTTVNQTAESNNSLIAQKWDIDNSSYIVNCFSSELITLRNNGYNKISTIAIQDLFNSGKKNKKGLRQKAATCFAENLSKSLPCESISYVIPDYVNEFDCTEIKRALNSKFHETSPIPSSIALSVSAENNNYFKDKLKDGDVIITVDLKDNELFLTPIKIQYDGNLEKNVPKSKGLQYIRYETYSEKLEHDLTESITKVISESANSYEEIKDQNFLNDLLKIFGLEYLASHAEEVIYTNNDDFVSINSNINSKLNELKITLTSKIVSNALASIGEEISAKSCRYILKKNDFIQFSKECSEDYICISCDNHLTEGAFFVTEIQNKLVNNYIWFDFLPKLSMSINIDALHVNELILVDKQKISPQLGKAVRIPIKYNFILPKNYKFYHFPLMQGIGNNISKYEAYIESPRFPLKEDLECSLELDYTYGADMPYSLKFVSKDLDQKYTVQWLSKEDIPVDYDSLTVPEFPEPRSFESLRKYPDSKWGSTDLIQDFIRDIDMLIDVESMKINPEHLFISSKEESFVSHQDGNDFYFSFKNYWKKSDSRDKRINWLFSTIKKDGFVFYRRNKKYNTLNVFDFNSLANKILYKTRVIFEGRKDENVTLSELQVAIEKLKYFIDNRFAEKNRYPTYYLSVLLKIYVIVFKEYSDNMIEIISGNYLEKLLPPMTKFQKRSTDYFGILAYAIGECEAEWQKKLCRKVKTLDDFYEIALVQIWLFPDFVSTLSIEQYEWILRKLLDEFKSLISNNYSYLCRLHTKNCSKTISKKFEFLLGLLRARSRDDVAFKKILSPTSELTEEFISIINQYINYIVSNEIRFSSNYDIEISREYLKNDKAPPLLNALLMYLNSENGSGSIRIAINTKNLSDDE